MSESWWMVPWWALLVALFGGTSIGLLLGAVMAQAQWSDEASDE